MDAKKDTGQPRGKPMAIFVTRASCIGRPAFEFANSVLLAMGVICVHFHVSK
jgi:hypothetical protein